MMANDEQVRGSDKDTVSDSQMRAMGGDPDAHDPGIKMTDAQTRAIGGDPDTVDNMRSIPSPEELHSMLAYANPAAPTSQEIAAKKSEADVYGANLLSDAIDNKNAPALNVAKQQDSGVARLPDSPTQPPMAPGSFADKLAASLSQARQGADAATLNEPGGWSKIMVGSVMDALTTKSSGPAKPPTEVLGGPWQSATSNSDATQPTTPAPAGPSRGQRILNNITGSLGDMAAATDNDGAGGAFGGIARTFQAQGNRQRQEMLDRQNIATANAQMLHTQALTHKLGEDQIAEGVKSGTMAMDAILNAPKGGTLITSGKTSDELKDMIAKGQLDPSRQTVFQTGRTQSGTDSNGQPLFRSTYSVVKLAGDITLDEKQAEYMNKDNPGQEFKAGQVLPAAQYNSQWQQAQTREAIEATRQSNLAQIGAKVDQAKLDHEEMVIGSDPTVQNALNTVSQGPDDPHRMVKAYNVLLGNKDFMAAHPNFPQTYPKWAGGGGKEGAATFEKMEQKYADAQDKTATTGVDLLHKLETDPKVLGTEGATAAYGAVLGAMVKNPEAYLPKGATQAQQQDVKERASRALEIVKSVENNNIQNKAKEAGAKKQAEEDASIGDPSTLIESALKYDLNPEKMQGVRGGLRAKFMTDVMNAAKARGIPWSEGEYEARYATTKDFKPEGKAGLQVQSLNTFAGHVGTAIDRIPALNNSASPDWNKAMNTIKVHVGDDQYGRMQAALSAVGKEYLNFLNNGHAATKSDDELAASLSNADMSPKAIHGVLAQMADTIAVRGGQLQRNYTTTMRKPYEGMLDPDSDKILQNLGVDTHKMKGTPAPGAPKKVGESFTQDGHTYIIDSVDANGKITGAH